MKQNFRFIFAILGISLANTASYEELPTPPSTERGAVSADREARAPHHRPAPHHPSPPSPPLANDSRFLLPIPQPLEYWQCDLGTEVFPVSQYADARRLYVDFGQLAKCEGEVVRWEFCYTVVSGGTESAQSSMISMVVLRKDRQTQNYRIVSVRDIDVDSTSGTTDGNSITCDFFDSEDGIIMQHGDLHGFVCGERVRIVFNSLQECQGGTLEGMLSVYNISVAQQSSMESLLQVGSTYRANQFKSLNQPLTPLLRLVMNVSNITSTTTEIPTTSQPTGTPCPNEGGGNSRDILTNTIFLSVVVTFSVVILFLLVLVLLLSCSLCQIKCRCYRLKSCCFVRRCCKGRDQVVQRIKVEPLSSSMEQSMQYNEMYVPSNPNQIKRISRSTLHKNPAYSGSQDLVLGVDEVDRADDSGVSDGRRGLEHTYEMIDTIR